MKLIQTLFFLLSSMFLSMMLNGQDIESEYSKEACLVLRQVDGLCDNKNPDYVCIQYGVFGDEFKMVKKYLKKNGRNVRKLMIENPSYIIDEINYKKLKNLESLVIFGNDYDLDGLTYLPLELLELKQLRSIEFIGVRFPSKSLAILKDQYSHLNFIGEVSEY